MISHLQTMEEPNNSTKRELEQIEISETHNHMFRSKIKWTEDGEKNCKLFISVETKITSISLLVN